MRNPTGSHRDAPLTVSFPVPKKAANKLRSLAISKDRRLLDLGVLAVQINEGESIVLGIKLGRRKLKRTEVESDKMKGNACRGRVTKRHSSLRNLGTVHHMPTSLSLADKPATTQITSFSSTSHSDERRASIRAGKSDGDALANELFSSMILGTSDKCTNGSNFHLSGYKTHNDNRGLSVNGVLSSSKSKVSRLDIAQNNGDLASGRGFSSSESNLRKSSNGTRRSSRETPPSPVVLSGSRILADRRLSSPNSQRANSVSPCSETSSTSSDENLEEEVRQLIYNCYMDQSKYSAANMLKQLAKAHTGTKETTKSTMGNTSVSSSVVKTVTVTPNSSSHSGISLGQPRISENTKRAAITGSYREHVKNIRCYSLTSLTTSTVTVNSTLNVPSSKNAQADTSQSCSGSIITDSPSFGERNLPTKPTTHSTPSKPCSSFQTLNILTSSSQTMSAYSGGRKVLWSSANVFPVNRSTLGSSIETSFSETATSLLQASKVSSPSISAQIDATTPSQTTTPVTFETKNGIHVSNKVPGEEVAKESKVVHSDLKTVIVKTPALALDPQASVTDSPQVVKPPTTLTVPNVQTTVSQGTKYVQNLTLARSTLPAANVVVAGTNTQTTWSNQQVSPTYILGTQTQYGIYPAMYNTDVNNNQLAQQAVPAGYPLNYVYPISFVYPYLSVAQPSSAKNPNGEKVKQEKGDTDVEKSDTSVLDGAAVMPRNDSSMSVRQGSSLSSADLVSTNSNTAPMQTQFIDLTSSMRYWQQLNLLYRSRLQALTPGSLSNVATALPSSQANTTSAAVTSTSDSSSVVCGTAAQSTLQEFAFSKSDLSHSNISKGSFSEILKRVKPKEGSELEQSDLKDLTNDRPSVIVAASCQDSTIKMENNCNETQFEGQELKEMNETFSPKFHSGKLQHFSEEDLAERSRVSTPTLSFVHDSSIAYVNIGNSNGNGHSHASYSGNHVGTRRTSLGAHEDSVIRPAKRKKAKRSL